MKTQFRNLLNSAFGVPHEAWVRSPEWEFYNFSGEWMFARVEDAWAGGRLWCTRHGDVTVYTRELEDELGSPAGTVEFVYDVDKFGYTELVDVYVAGAVGFASCEIDGDFQEEGPRLRRADLVPPLPDIRPVRACRGWDFGW